MLNILTQLLILLPITSISKPLVLKVTDPAGKGIANIVVYLEASHQKLQGKPAEIAIMDQIDTQFMPHILPVQKNTLVQFPNSDSIKHHVYSFSAAKTFELQLYKNLQADPLLFSKPGVVELGCNVHDWMLGYIFIVDTPYFAKTNGLGQVSIEVPIGEYEIKVWSPLIQDDLDSLTTRINVTNATSEQKIVLQKALLPNLHQYENEDEFSEYD
jgi:plastocyanin